MIESLATSYFQFFPGDFIVFGITSAVVWLIKKVKDDEFYE
jgi:hypothetical protein